MRRSHSLLTGLVPLWLAAACATLPAPTPAPQLRTRAPLDAAPAAQPPGEWPAEHWWLSYQDPLLATLIERALQQSPSMDQAAARFEAAQQQLRLASALRGLQVEATASVQRSRLSDNGMFPPRFLGFHWYSQTDLGVRARYGIDWWGKQRALVAAATSESRAAAAERAAAALALAAAVADAYFGWQADQARLALAREQLDLGSRSLHLVTLRARAGLETDDAVQQATARRAGILEQVATLEGSAELRRVLLAALIGCAPAELPPLQVRPLPGAGTALPADLGLDLIGRRADITASRWRVEAALQGVKAARAEFLPDISLSALAALSSIDYDKLFEAGSRTPAVGVAVHLPLFDSGVLRARHAARQAALRAAIADYDSTVLDAAREVSQQLVLRQQIESRRHARVTQSEAVARLAATAERRVQQGLTDIRPQLAAAGSLLEQRAAELELRAAAIAADVALIQALGGGYASSRNPT
ncbi:MAG: efflux transporter outer membrane subunit [Gammaproteobacteria bacterium]|nr:efflux transporter outer membrane subunit [Gammaproteobacteria bacterium]